MFQHFYLISLLLCIKLVFSYEYLDDPGRAPRNIGKDLRQVNTAGRRKDRRNSIRQDYGYDKSPIEFDVAGFIQPDEETIADNEEVRRRNQRRRRTKNNDRSFAFGNAAKEGNTRDTTHDYLGMGDSANLKPSLIDLGPPLLKDSLNIKKFKMNSLDEANARYANENFKNQIVLKDPDPAHNPQKKCVFKSIKFPFFSHNKTESLKPKKNKKRRLFGFSYDNKSESEISSDKDKLQINQYKNKRSYQIKLCPACKKKYIDDNIIHSRVKKTTDDIIHNSRQFYQKQSDIAVTEEINRNTEYYNDYPRKLIKTDRRKRDELDKERQLKLLEEIERKVDNVKRTEWFKASIFSRTNKTDSIKPKITKKRKLFCFNCTKKKSKDKRKQSDTSLIDTIHDDKKSKRSYEENLCPVCKQKFISFESNDKLQIPWNRPMHNRLISEKYTEEKIKDNLKVDPNEFNYSDANGKDFGLNQRDKREEPGILMNRELDMIQQMIEHEDVREPQQSNTKSTSPPPD